MQTLCLLFSDTQYNMLFASIDTEVNLVFLSTESAVNIAMKKQKTHLGVIEHAPLVHGFDDLTARLSLHVSTITLKAS